MSSSRSGATNSPCFDLNGSFASRVPTLSEQSMYLRQLEYALLSIDDLDMARTNQFNYVSSPEP